MTTSQPGILADVPRHSRYMTFTLCPGADPILAVTALGRLPVTAERVLGLGPALVAALEAEVPGLRPHPHLVGAGVAFPATGGDLWCWLRGEDRGALVHAGREVAEVLVDAFDLEDVTDGFMYLDGHDLSGYEDGTENPKGAEAVATGFTAAAGEGLDGGSFVGVQRWVHELDLLEAMTDEQRDHVIGRRLSDNEELADAPPSAHVKRTAQESFEPPAFLLRRSMPWTDGRGDGLVFVAFGSSLDSFERQLRRMAGIEDGVVDALFRFTRPVTGATFWCPPVHEGMLDLRKVGISYPL